MFVRKIKSNKGIIEVNKYDVDRINVHDDGTATYYTAGGNIFTVKVKEVVNDDGISRQKSCMICLVSIKNTRAA